MNPSSCVSMEIRVADEPAGHLAALVAALEELFDAIGDVPRTLWPTSPGGRAGRTRAFSWDAVRALGGDTGTGTLSSIELRSNPVGERPDSAVLFQMSLYLRHDPSIALEYQPPARLWVAMAAASAGSDQMPAAAATFMTRCAEQMPLLHGGVTLLDNVDQAASEVTGTATYIERQSATFQRRHEHDWRFSIRGARAVCRRLYWTTLLGPALAQAAGGAEAARAAGALDVREVNESLIFRAMEGPPRDSLDPGFLAATVRLRRWLWPHTFQNPLDAAGFEAEVGLPVPAPA